MTLNDDLWEFPHSMTLKVMGAADASLIALHVMTSERMPKEVYLEDVIERVVKMVKVQLQQTIFPNFDPVYRIDPKNKSTVNTREMK